MEDDSFMLILMCVEKEEYRIFEVLSSQNQHSKTTSLKLFSFRCREMVERGVIPVFWISLIDYGMGCILACCNLSQFCAILWCVLCMPQYDGASAFCQVLFSIIFFLPSKKRQFVTKKATQEKLMLFSFSMFFQFLFHQRWFSSE